MLAHRDSSTVQLNIELGYGFLRTFISKYGTTGWNSWLDAMTGGNRYMSLGWDEHEPAPPIWFWIDLQDANFSGQNLDGIRLGLAWCQGARFDFASAVGAVFGSVPQANFRNCDLRGSSFEYSDISGADFSNARLDGIRLQGSSFLDGFPPLGLPDSLLRLCHPDTNGAPSGMGTEEIPVPIVGSLAIVQVSR